MAGPMRDLFRPDPKLPVSAMQTYAASARTRPATCREVECAARENGWASVIDVGTELGRRQANYIRLKSGRHFTATELCNTVTFTFPPGQQCFAQHTIPIGALYVKQGGDWRATTSTPVQMREADWIDDQQNTLDGIRTAQQRG